MNYGIYIIQVYIYENTKKYVRTKYNLSLKICKLYVRQKYLKNDMKDINEQYEWKFSMEKNYIILSICRTFTRVLWPIRCTIKFFLQIYTR